MAMIEEIAFSNYKAFNEGRFSLRPLTIFIGGNSSGKSSVTHIPLLFFQTANSSRYLPTLRQSRRFIDLNGFSVQLGDAKNLIKDRDPSKELAFEFRLEANASFDEAIVEIRDSFLETLWETLRTYYLYLRRDQPEIEHSELRDLEEYLGEAVNPLISNRKSISIKDRDLLNRIIKGLQSMKDKTDRDNSSNDPKANVLLRRYSRSRRALVLRQELKAEEDYLWTADFIEAAERSTSRTRFLKFTLKYSEDKKDFAVSRLALGYESVTLLDFTFSEPGPNKRQGLREVRGAIDNRAFPKYASIGKMFNYQGSMFDLVVEDPFVSNDPLISRTIGGVARTYFDALRSAFAGSTFNYVGPLRDTPRKYYIQGDQYRERRPTSDVPIAELIAGSEVLHERTNEWLRHFATRIEIDDSHEDIHRVKTIRNDRDQDLDISNVGFGVSQILPVVVQALIAVPGSTTIVEQPEIHLHPNMQAHLVDFFVQASKGSPKERRRFIIETHSATFLNRLRLRIAQQKVNRSDVAIYSFEINEDNCAFIEEVTLFDDGDFDWPRDFMEEELKDIREFSRIRSSINRQDEESL